LSTVLLLAFVLRFTLLDRLSVWPNTDEGMNGILAWDLSREWRWKFFWSFGELPPLFTWVLALCVRTFGLSNAALWAVPAFVSFCTVPAAYWAARAWGSRSSALLVLVLAAFSFWPMVMGRFCHQGVLLPLWACLLVWALGRYVHDRSQRPSSSILLGAAAGAGSFLFTAWPALAGLVLAVVFFRDLKRGAVKRFAFVLGCFLVTVTPFVIAVFREGYGSHMRAVSAFRGYFPLGQQVLTDLSYLTALLWGMLVPGHAYGAPWGGLLNPLMGAFFLLGLIDGVRRMKNPLALFVWAAFLAALLPGLLSMNVQMFRVAAVLPFLLFFTVLGLQSFALTLKEPGRAKWLLFLLAAASLWDVYGVARPYVNPPFSKAGVFRSVTPGKPFQMYRAFKTLQGLAKDMGPGLILTSFTPPYNDATLFTGTFPFNTAVNPNLSQQDSHLAAPGQEGPVRTVNPKWDPGQAKWTAFVVNIHYQPYLRKRYPLGRWVWLDFDTNAEDGGWMLGIVPAEGMPPGEAQRWLKVHGILLETDVALHRLPDGGPFRNAMPVLEKAWPLVKGDAFLTALYWEKAEHIRYQDADYKADVEALKHAIGDGLPAAHLLYKLGSIQFRKLEFAEGRANLKRALATPENLTRAEAALVMLQSYEKAMREAGALAPGGAAR
jgi:4-amino-4-deoxy-L-arabinose transferase-like glycosyltransferase